MRTENVDKLRNEDGKLPAHAWPGGYQMFYFTRDGLTVCPNCANREVDDSEAVIEGDVYWEGPTIPCEDCGDPIASAYGDPEECDTDPEYEFRLRRAEGKS